MSRFRIRRRWRHLTVVALSVAMVGGLVGTTTAAPRAGTSAEPGDLPVPEIDWTSCGSGELQDFQCATVEVPTDYDHPDGATTTIALTKLPATDPEQRIGSLFTNPGGPGGSGVDFIQLAGKVLYAPEVREHFDIIGFDPRGVARSDPVTCYANAEAEADALAGIPEFPVTRAQEKRYIRRMLELTRNCMTRSGDRIAHSSTANVARDMDLLRQAVGDEKLTYAGYSYGTFLGATYAKLFPDNVRALMLDAVLEPNRYTGRKGGRHSIGTRIGQGWAASRTYGEFLRLCEEAGPARCALAELGDPRTVMERTLRSLKTDPVTIDPPDGPPIEVTYPYAVATLFTAMYGPLGWADLAETFALVARESQARRARVGEDLERRRADVAEYLRLLHGEDYPSIGGALASMCVDTTSRLRPEDYPAEADREDATSPHFGRFRAWAGLSCAVIGHEDDDAYLGNWKQRLDVPVMVVGTRYDPATPYEYTRPFADTFPDARVLTLEGWGHGGSVFKSACADRQVARYLVELTATDGATCRPNALPFAEPPSGSVQERALATPGPAIWGP